MDQSEFVNEAILELLHSGRVMELNGPPDVTSVGGSIPAHIRARLERDLWRKVPLPWGGGRESCEDSNNNYRGGLSTFRGVKFVNVAKILSDHC